MHKGFFTDVMQHRPALFATMLAFNGVAAHGRGREGLTASQSLSTSGPANASQAACLQALSAVQGLSPSGMASLAASPVVQRHMKGAGLTPSSLTQAAPSEEPLSLSPSSSLGADVDEAQNPSDAPHNSPDLPSATTPQQNYPQFWDFAEESRRLAFLSHKELSALIQFFGVALHAKYYAHLVHHADVVALRRALGPELHAYGLVRGRFQVGSVTSFFMARSQVLGTKGQSLDVDTILQNIKRDGDIALGLCMASWPPHLQERTCALMGRHISPILDADAAVVRGVWFALKKLLLREVAPQWAPCFD